MRASRGDSKKTSRHFFARHRLIQALGAAGLVMILVVAFVIDTEDKQIVVLPDLEEGRDVFVCKSPFVADGDSLTCAGVRVRLQGIDAPEMPGHCRSGRRCVEGDPYAAKSYLKKITRGAVTCNRIATDHYGRTIARCESQGRDLSCAMLASGLAERRYAAIRCDEKT